MRRTFLFVSLSLLLVGSTSCEDPTEQEKKIEQRDRKSNGILVGAPKVYDDSMLQQMLSTAQARLTSLQLLDQTGIAARLGSITGANQQISSFAVAAQGPTPPQSVLTSNGATSQVASTVGGSSGNSTVTTTTAPVENLTTTSPQLTAPAATPPAPSTSLPSSFSVSASDILNEQMQLTYEIANLRLLLEGPLNDRIARTKDGKNLIKPRATLGFPITLNPDKRFKGAVAVVEVEVETIPGKTFNDDPPAIMALLPREKTYNVAAIKDHSGSIGAGVVTQVAGVSGSFLFGRKTYYVVQDQDTLALTFEPEEPATSDIKRIGFLWQFRPVLGEDYAQAGLKQTFVQIAFPSPATANPIGKVKVRTYWRRYDRNTGVLKEIVQKSLWEETTPIDIPTFVMKQDISALSKQDLEDLGNGQMLVHLTGNFLSGTYVRVGSNIIQPGAPGFTSEYSGIRFLAPLSDLATKKTVVVTRDGTEVPIVVNQCLDKNASVSIVGKSVSLTAIDETNSLLRFDFDLNGTQAPCQPFVIVIGGKVFGYSDAPILRQGNTLSVMLPTSFLVSNPEVTVKPLMLDDRYFAKMTLFEPNSELEHLALLSQDGKTGKYLLYGRNLDDVEAVAPAVKLETVGDAVDSNSLRSVELSVEAGKSPKQLILQHKNGRPFVVSVPALPTTDQAKQDPKFQERVTVGSDEATIIGDDLSKISHVFFQKAELKATKSSDGKFIKITGLVAAGATSAARTQDIDLITVSGKTTIKLEIVNSKIESITK
jgi:hypothetical protein